KKRHPQEILRAAQPKLLSAPALYVAQPPLTSEGRRELHLISVALHQRDGRRWAQLPSKPMLKDGESIHEPGGRIRCAKMPEFEGEGVRQAFNDRVWSAYEAFRPP